MLPKVFRMFWKVLDHFKMVLKPVFESGIGVFPTCLASIRAAAERRQIELETVEWIVIAQLEQDQITIKTTRSCPQGGVLSSLS
jgi:hypothetical protein